MTKPERQFTAASPAWSRIADEIAAAIERGDHPRGTLLPGASDLAAHFDVNRHTVRQALLHLQGLGLLRVERGRGTTVVGTRVPYRIGRQVSLRTNLARAGIAASGEVLSSMRRPATSADAERLGLHDGSDVWCIETLNRAAGVPVSTSEHVLACARFPDFPERLAQARASFTAAFAYYGIGEYVRLSTKLVADRATEREGELLDIAPGDPVMRSDAIDGLPDGTPLQGLSSAFAGARVEMVVTLDTYTGQP